MTFEKGYNVGRHFFTDEERRMAGKTRTRKTFEAESEILWEDLSLPAKKRRVLQEQNGKCNKCGIDEWLGIELVLEFHHKDGNKANNSRANVEYLCPNCHSQTPTDRFRNRKHTEEAKIKMVEMRLGK